MGTQIQTPCWCSCQESLLWSCPLHSGYPIQEYIDMAVRHVYLRQGVLGIKVKIMLPWDPTGKTGPKKPLPDHVSIVEPKEEVAVLAPSSEQKGGKPDIVPPPAVAAPAPDALM